MDNKIINTLKGVAFLLLVSLYSCTDYNYIDGGLANGVHDCTMWEYFENQTQDWDSTMVMIEHAGMKSYFDGSGQYKQITFFGITDITIARFILQHNRELDSKQDIGLPVDENAYWHRVKDMPADSCAAILKKLIVPEQRIMLKDIPQGNRLVFNGKYKESGGKPFTTLYGDEIFTWMVPEDYGDLEDAGAKVLWIARRRNTSSNYRIASTDIQTTTGVVNSMDYGFTMGNF
ncbi:hypothetical protein [Butyricimonas sp.]|uniref:hypothetical protein n=1 Tax=Butyricimonas sp. TaxID=1969738 RepID=UPI0025C4D989|nr:hypothetical protein [Butyricimonas sp.]